MIAHFDKDKRNDLVFTISVDELKAKLNESEEARYEAGKAEEYK